MLEQHPTPRSATIKASGSGIRGLQLVELFGLRAGGRSRAASFSLRFSASGGRWLRCNVHLVPPRSDRRHHARGVGLLLGVLLLVTGRADDPAPPSRDSASPSATPSPHSTTVTESSSDVSRSSPSWFAHAAEPVGIDVYQPQSPREERKITLCNGGLMALDGKQALACSIASGTKMPRGNFISPTRSPSQANGLKAVAVETAEDDVRGINTKAQLAETEAVLQQRLRQAALEAGVTMIAPRDRIFVGRYQDRSDVTIEPNVVIGPGVTVDAGATIHSFSHLDGAHIGKGARVGPYARLRPGAKSARMPMSAISSR